MISKTILFLAFSAVGMATIACKDPELLSVSGSDVDLADLNPSVATADADGETIVRLTARVPSDSKRSPAQVTFQTDAGVFVANGLKEVVSRVDAVGMAFTDLKAPADPALATIRAFAGQTVLANSVQFNRTFPDIILVEPSQFVVANNSTVVLRARLGRLEGAAPTKGAEVTFSATDTLGTAIGLWGISSLSDADGLATVQFCPCRMPPYEGKVIVRATTQKKIGEVAGTAAILVTKE